MKITDSLRLVKPTPRKWWVAGASVLVVAAVVVAAPVYLSRREPVSHHQVTLPPSRMGSATEMAPVAAPGPDPVIDAAAAKTAAVQAAGVRYPDAAAATVDVPVSGSPVSAAGMPVRVGPAPGSPVASGSPAHAAAAARLRVAVADQAKTVAAGIDGMLVSLADADLPAGVAAAASGAAVGASVVLDYGGFAAAGGDYAARLQLVSLPACALTDPTQPACQQRTPVPFHNSLTARTITAALTVPSGQPLVLAVTPAPTSGAGSYTSTSLSASATWQAGASSGDFTWSYPLRVPPANGGPAPDLSISYDSQSLDGRLPANNNQPSWVGDGFDLSSSYIERSYGSCVDDGQSGKYDLCWKYDNATLVLNGIATELIKDDTTGMWRPKADNGVRVQHTTTGSAAVNGDNDGERWTVTETDGTQYVFGMNQLPGWTSTAAVTNSVWTVPVYGDDAGEPCHGATFADSSCPQAWRWNLDYVVDPDGNTETLWYTPEYNYYAQNGVTSANGVKYTRGGYLSRIDYGQTASTIYTSTAPQQVAFTTSERCIVTSTQPCTTLTSANKADWPDVPFDQICAANTHCTAGQVAPTFFSTRRLTRITTQYWTGTGTTYQPVDQWDLTQSFPATGDGTSPPLWLNAIKHTGEVGSPLAVNDVSFTGIQLTNRVDTSDDSIAALIRWRVRTITSETGSVITVNYLDPECVGGTTMPAPDANTKRCFPAFWTPPGATSPRLDWFQKYPVNQVLQSDPTGGSPTVEYDYTYSGAAWRYADDNALTPTKYKTWSRWRGYATVLATQGAATDQRTATKTLYFQGMDGDKLAAGGTKAVTVTDSQHTQVVDAEPLAGQPREQITYNGVNSAGVTGAEVSGEITDKFIYKTASQVQPWGTSTANIVRDAAVHTRTDLAGGGARTQTVTTTYDTSTSDPTKYPRTGLPLTVDDTGDAAISGDERCTRTTYAQNLAAWLMDLQSRAETVAVACAATPNRPTDVISDDRTSYDGLAFGATPTKGDPTRTEQVASYNGTTPVYQTVDTTSYDPQGRPLVVTDARGNPTTTTYTPTSGGPLTQTTVTNALGHKTTTTINPAWGSTTTVVDPNNQRTDLTYDALGELVKVWLPNRSKAIGQNPNIQYAYNLSNTTPSTITTQNINNDGSTYLTTSISFYNALLHPRQVQTPAPGGGRVISQTDYNTLGQAVAVGEDYTDATSPSTSMATITSTWPRRTTTTYDGAGRDITTTLLADGAAAQVTTTTYGGDRTTITPPTGGEAITTITDIRNQVTERDQYDGNQPTGAVIATIYTYTPAGQQHTITDPAGNLWSFTYDLQGHQITAVDPDHGTSVTSYDANGNIADTTDALAHKLVYTYDALDRKTAEYTGSIAPANQLAGWTYDTVAKGQLTSSTRYVGGSAGAAYVNAVTTYDPLYRPTATRVTIPNSEPAGIAGTYTSTTAYNLDGTTQLHSMPAGGGLATEALTYTYNDTRQPRTMQGSTGLVQGALYTKLGQPQQVTLAVSPNAPWVQITNSYEDGTRRLHNTLVTDDTHTAPDVNATTTYDPNGNITQIDNQGGGADDNQCLSYDGHTRLHEAWTSTTSCNTAPTTTLLGGPAPYWLTWSYDTNTGLRTRQVNHTTAGDSQTDYTYAPTVSGGPHALQSTTTTSIGAPTNATYGYNADGQTTSRPGSTSQQTLIWDTEGDLTTITEGTATTTNVYDADGNLLISHGPTESVLYLAGEQIHVSSSGALSNQRELTFAGNIIAVRTNTTLSWLINDPHGTATAAIDATTQTVTDRYATPFNTPRGTPPANWPDSNGFLGEPNDPTTGLTYLGAREYDPTTGTFLTTDPILDPTDPQSLDDYPYADNDPTTNADPTGTSCNSFTGPGCATSPPPPSHPHGPSHPSSGGGHTSSGNTPHATCPPYAPCAKGPIQYPPAKRIATHKIPVQQPHTQGTCHPTAQMRGVDWSFCPTPPPSDNSSLNKAWQVARNVINLPFSSVAFLWATAAGASCRESYYSMTACTGAAPWANGRSGTTIGSVYITGDSNPSFARLRHEEKHADQWAIFGPALIPLYFALDTPEDLATTGSCNPFEQWAGLGDGNYPAC